MRGTSTYFKQSKNNVMATIFLTLSCAEFDWPELLKKIIETVQRQRVLDDYIAQLSATEKHRIISDNVVQSTLHFLKRIKKCSF